jgi:endonuclease/exonuclease/phosphatase family metal-dependent hydrolase
MGLKSRAHVVLVACVAALCWFVVQPITTSTAAPVSAAASKKSGPVVQVASFNIRAVKNDVGSGGNEQPWRQRRGPVIRQILREHLDVVGVQEASQNGSYKNQMVDGRNQFLDLRNGLREAGGRWRLTSKAAYNCVRPYGSHDCVYKDRGASRTTKILFDADKVEKLDSGSYLYRHQSAGENDQRYLVWAVFKDLSSNERFFFANTHLATGSAALQKAQWRELIDKVNQLKNGLPTIVVGDFQRSRMKNPVRDMLDAMKSNGYGDVLGQRAGEPTVENPRAQSTVKSWVNSMNHFDRDVEDFSHEDDRDREGSFIDWIFASNELPVRQYEVVADINPHTMKLRGVIPSDHNMVRASIVLR